MAELSGSGAAGPQKNHGGYKSMLDRLVRLNMIFYFLQYSSISYTLVLSQSLFLKKAGPDFIPASFITLNCMLVIFEFALLALNRIPEFRVLVFSITAGTFYTFICNFYLFEYQHYLIYFAYFVFGYIFVILTIFGYLTYLNGLLPLRAQKIHMPYIHGASSLGAVFSGFSLKYLISAFSVSGVLNLIVILNVASLALIFAIERARIETAALAPKDSGESAGDDPAEIGGAVKPAGAEETPDASGIEVESTGGGSATESESEPGGGLFKTLSKRFAESFDYARNTRLAYYLIIITFLVNFQEAMIDFVFSSRLAEEFANVDQMASFTGTFRAVNMLVVMSAQFFVLKPFLSSFSVCAAMTLMPVFIIPISSAGLVFYFFSTVISLKFFHELVVKCFNRPSVGIFTNAMAGRKTKMFVFYEISAYSSKILAGSVLFVLKPFVGTHFFIYFILLSAMVYFYFTFKLEPAYISALESNLKAGSVKDKISAINRMNYIPAKRAIEALAPLLRSGDAEERFNAVKKIAEFEGSSAILYDALGHETDPKVTATIISKLAADPAAEAAITNGMAGFGGSEATEKLEALFNHENRRVKANFIEGFANFSGGRNAAAVSTRLAAYLDSADFRIRSSAIISVLGLSEDGGEMRSAIDGLYAMAVSKEPKARASAAYVMGRLRSPAFIGALAELIGDADPGIRNYCAAALINIGGTAPEEILRKRLAGETDAGVIKTIEDGLNAMSNDGRAEVSNLLKRHSLDFRNQAGQLLKNVDIDRYYPLIVRLLLVNQDEVKIDILKCVSKYAGDAGYMKFVDSMIGAAASVSFAGFEEMAMANNFKVERRYLELYGAAAPRLKEENRRFITRLIEIYGGVPADGGPVIQTASAHAVPASLLNFIFECVAISSGDYEGTLKNFKAALSPDASISSYAAELIETVLDGEIAGKIVAIIEKHRES
jgi:HEAT repeat protein